MKEAARYFSLAADQDFELSQVRINLSFQGCRQNRTEENRTEQCRQTERSSGNPWYCLIPEQINLGNMYYNGIGVERDISKAKELYSQAAKTNKNAQLLLQELEEEMARPKDT